MENKGKVVVAIRHGFESRWDHQLVFVEVFPSMFKAGSRGAFKTLEASRV